MSDSGPARPEIGQLPGADPVGPGQVLDQHLGGGIDLEPVLCAGAAVLEIGEDAVRQQPEAALAQLQAEHQGTVEVVQDVLEAGIDLRVDLADAGVTLERRAPDIGCDAEFPGVGGRPDLAHSPARHRRRRPAWLQLPRPRAVGRDFLSEHPSVDSPSPHLPLGLLLVCACFRADMMRRAPRAPAHGRGHGLALELTCMPRAPWRRFVEHESSRGGHLGEGARMRYSPLRLASTASICALTAAMLKLAPFCIGGYSMKVCAALATSCWTNTKRQNS